MKENEAPEKIYIPRLISDGKLIHEWNDVPFKKFRFFFDKEIAENVEYTRTDAFIEKAERYIRSVADGLDRDDDVEAFINEFIKYMKGE